MKKFGDEIKIKLNQGEMDYSSSSWEMMEKKLSEVPSRTDFEKKIEESLSGSTVSMPIGSWDQFTQNANLLNELENSLSKKLNNGAFNSSNNSNWEEFSEKYNNSRLTSYEKKIKDVWVVNTKSKSK